MAILPYTKTVYINDQAPAINDDNLNNNEDGLEAVTNEVIRLDSVTQDLSTPASVPFVPQDPIPTAVEGLLFYDDTKKDIAFFDDTGEIHHISQALNVRVVNNTGTTIDAGMAVKYNNAIVNGLPTIALAQADIFSNARVVGITKAPILDGAEGTVVTDGVISNLDTSGYTAGDYLYLSDTVAGTLTDIPPEIVCRVGGAFTSSASGELGVRLENYVALPTALASMHGGAGPATITAVWSDITNYTENTNIIMDFNETTGEIYAPVAGIYRDMTSMSITFDDVGNTDITVYVRAVGDAGWVGTAVPFQVARNGVGATFYPSTIQTLPGNENYKIQISSTADITNVVYNYVSYSLEALNVNV